MEKKSPKESEKTQSSNPNLLVIDQARDAVQQLPKKYRRKFEDILGRIEMWIDLQNVALKELGETAGDLRLENLSLRFDLDMTRRENNGEIRRRDDSYGDDHDE